MENLEDLPAQVAGQIQETIDNQAQDRAAEMHEADIKLERERIRSQERMHEREIIAQENMARMQSDVEQYRSMLDEMFSKIGELFSHNAPVIEVDASHDETEIPAANEDAAETPPENNAGENEPQETPLEGIEEIGGNVENEVNDNVESVTDNAEPGKSGRKRRRGNRR